MADCEFVKIDSTWLPGVSAVVESPVYVTDSERSISGVLRTDHTGVAREWRVDLTGVPGSEVATLRAFLIGSPSPRQAEIMGEVTQVEVRLDRLSHRPRILRGRSLAVAGDKMRADMTLTLREITPKDPLVSP